MPKVHLSVPELLEKASDTFTERGDTYGDSVHRFGATMAALFPDGITLHGAQDWDRMGLLVQIVSKLTRYVNDFQTPHLDSIHDMGVYAFMLEAEDTKLPDPFS